MANELTIPQRLEWLLQQRGVSQNALARASKVSPQTIANTLHHGRVPQARTTRRWAQALGVPTNFFAAKPLTEDQLLGVIDKAGAFSFAGARTTKGTSSTTTRKAPTVTKATTKKATTKSTAARKTTTTASKASAKPAAKRATVKQATAGKATSKTTAKKPVAKKPVATKPVAKKTVAKKPAAQVRYGTVKKTATKTTTKTSASSAGMLGLDRDALLKKLVKLSNSKQDAVALDATKTLLTYVK